MWGPVALEGEAEEAGVHFLGEEVGGDVGELEEERGRDGGVGLDAEGDVAAAGPEDGAGDGGGGAVVGGGVVEGGGGVDEGVLVFLITIAVSAVSVDVEVFEEVGEG